MNDAASMPVRANVMADQKIRSLMLDTETIVSSVNSVAEPNVDHAASPIAARMSTASQRAIAPALFSHLPTFMPTTFMKVATPSRAMAVRVMNVLLSDSP